MTRVFNPEEGFFSARIDGNNRVDPKGHHSVILQSRVLWTFSAAIHSSSRQDSKLMKLYQPYQEAALHTLQTKFSDTQYGGFYWSLEPDFSVLDDAKRTYGQSFVIYAYSEAYKTTGREALREQASDLFLMLDEHGYIPDQKAWHEGFTRDWKPLEDVRISPDDPLEIRSTNTHLHLLEAFAHLYRIWPDSRLKNRLTTLLEIFLTKIYSPSNRHFFTFFDENWDPSTSVYSFGHDIETVWLMLDAAKTIDSEPLTTQCERVLVDVADHLIHKGIDSTFGGVYQLGENGTIYDTDKHWWPQAEALIGLATAFELTGEHRYMQKAIELWSFIRQNMMDHENGEWFFRLDRYGEPYYFEDKAGPWKCPYHTSRAMMLTDSILERKHSNTRTNASVIHTPMKTS